MTDKKQLKLNKWLITFVAFVVSVLSLFSATAVQAQEAEDDLLAEIQEQGVIRMGVASGYAPFEFIVNEGGENEITGVDIFLGERIAEDLGVELELVDMEFPNLITSMETGTIDMIISGMAYTEERDESIDFSNPYHIDYQSFAVRAGEVDEIDNYQTFIDEDLVVGVQENTIQETVIRETLPADAEIVVMRKSGDVIAALQAGQVDGALFDNAVASAYAAENPDLDVVPSGLDTEDRGKSVGIPEGEENLQAAINETVDEVAASGQVDEWLEDSYAIISENQQDSWLQYWPYFWDGIKTTLLISFVSIIVGTILGGLLALMRISGVKLLEIIARL